MIAAAYAALTFVNPLSFGPVQFRISELLTILCCLTPAAIPGLTIGCFIANTASFMPLDLLIGTASTLIAAVLGYAFRRVCLHGYPVLSAFFPVVTNGILVGLELCFYAGNFTPIGFLTAAGSVALGEAGVCLIALCLFPVFKRIRY